MRISCTINRFTHAVSDSARVAGPYSVITSWHACIGGTSNRCVLLEPEPAYCLQTLEHAAINC